MGRAILAFKQELEKLGWADGRNIQFDERWTTDNMDTVRAGAASLVASKSRCHHCHWWPGYPYLDATVRLTPIVIRVRAIRLALVGRKALRGRAAMSRALRPSRFPSSGKSLGILKQLAPAIVRVALIYNPDNPNTVFYRRTFEAAAGALAIEPIAFPVHGMADIDRAVTSLADSQNAGVFFAPDATTNALRDEIVDLLARRHMPIMYSESFFAKIGGLASYTADRSDMFRQSASYVDRILRGDKPGDLPFQQQPNTSS